MLELRKSEELSEVVHVQIVTSEVGVDLAPPPRGDFFPMGSRNFIHCKEKPGSSCSIDPERFTPKKRHLSGRSQ